MLDVQQQLTLIARAWGKQQGYCFFPWISGTASNREGRIRSYHEGTAYKWPADKETILAHLTAHCNDDVYWCPSLFERRRRQMELAMDEHCLWADLDEVDPKGIEDYPPTIAWETSPGRYQALWVVMGGDMQGASWQGGENQRLTYYLGADAGGWDTTQLLRIPGWKNHKPEYIQKYGKPPQGKLLWSNGRRYLQDDFEELPEINVGMLAQTLLDDEIERVDRHKIYGDVRLKLPKTARELFGAHEAMGDRSEKLWWLMRCLADVGCSVVEIVAIVRPTVWNKFSGRNDELRRLSSEAAKAVATQPEKPAGDLEVSVDEDRGRPIRLMTLLANVKPPKWLVQGLISEGACGFIAGQPKSYKSWIGLDLALSVATGLPFLDHFPIRAPGPVLYLQEEDGLPMVKSRVDKIWPSKKADKVIIENGTAVWVPPDETADDPDVAARVNKGFVVSDPGWQSWLDEMIDEGLDGKAYRMVIMDPLMVIAGEVEENRSVDMTQKIFRPLRQLAEKHGVAMVIVHHMRKGDPSRPTRGGQLMLGSVANHAWSEDSMYLRVVKGGDVLVERESKHTTSGSFKISRLRNHGWTPVVVDDKLDEWIGDHEQSQNGQRRSKEPRKPTGKALAALDELGSGTHTTKMIAQQAGLAPSTATKQLVRYAETGWVKKVSVGHWSLENKS